MPSRGRSLAGAVATAGVIVLGACVDLFHSTDFPTLCATDPDACRAADAAPGADAVTDAPEPLAPVDFCTWSSDVALEHARRACAWLGACSARDEVGSFGTCMVHALAAYDCRINPDLRPLGRAKELWTCLADVSSCPKVAACLFGSTRPTCARLEAGAFTACSPDPHASAVIACAAAPEPALAFTPCALEGRSCAELDPSIAICAGPRGNACTGPAGCVGTRAVHCSGTKDDGIDCAAFGSGTCVEGEGGAGPACAPIADAGACDAASAAITCDADGGASACVGGRAVRIGCDALAGGCKPGGTALLPLAACANADPATWCTGDTCDGDTVRSCVQGRAFEVACASVGLERCVAAAGARCTARPERHD